MSCISPRGEDPREIIQDIVELHLQLFQDVTSFNVQLGDDIKLSKQRSRLGQDVGGGSVVYLHLYLPWLRTSSQAGP